MVAGSAEHDVHQFAIDATPGARNLENAAVQLAALMAGETAVIAEENLTKVEAFLGHDEHSKPLDAAAVLSERAQEFLPGARYVVRAIALGVEKNREAKS